MKNQKIPLKTSKSRVSARAAEAAASASASDGRSGLVEALSHFRGVEKELGQVIRSMEEKVQQLEFLTEFSSLLNSTLDPVIVREKALEATCRMLRCETASLLLVDQRTGELERSGVRLPINDRSIAGWVAMTGEAQLVNDVESDIRFNRGVVSGFRTRTMICIPLKAKGRVIGVLQAINRLPSAQPRQSRHAWPVFYAEELRLLETLGHQTAIALDNSRLYLELKNSFFDTVEALSEAIEKKDHYTGGHTKRVVHYSMCIARHVPGLSADQLERIRLGALLHDVGKIGIEDKILKKPSALAPDEWKVMQEHPELGYEIMSRVEGLRDVIGAMRFHHERWDGKGYPLGLRGEEIPLLARIIAIADTYDAMVSTRPYRKGLDPIFAHDEIVRNSGTQFDPMGVSAFVEAFKIEKMGRGSGGSTLRNSESAVLSNCD